jgi:hypothetical protein
VAQLETENCVVTYLDDQSTRDAVFQRLLTYFAKHEAFSGESIFQRDAPSMDASCVLSDIAEDIFKFSVTEKE